MELGASHFPWSAPQQPPFTGFPAHPTGLTSFPSAHADNRFGEPPHDRARQHETR